MKKLFISILALTAFAACQSDLDNDLNLDVPQQGGANGGGSHIIYAEVGIGEEDTKATYGDDLKALWEENDQIALLQEHADYGKPFSVVNKLGIKEGWGTSKAAFNGDISVDATDPRVYHIAYPASAVSFNVETSMQPVNVSYDDSYTLPGYDDVTATGAGQYTYTSTLNITVPTTQSGKWEPYMYASTSESVSSNGIGAKTLNTLTGAIAIRAFEADGTTPKQLSQITITSTDAAIAGAFSGTATSVGLTDTKSGASTGNKSNVLNSAEEIKGWALDNLISVLQDMEPASTSVTKAMSLSFAGSAKSITADVSAISMDSDGYYTYYINVAPATLAAGSLTIVATDTNGSALTRTIDKEVTLTASHRTGFTLTWESATLNAGDATIETWYDDWNKGSQFELEGSSIYVDNFNIEGHISAENVLAIGVKLNGTLHETSLQSGKLEISPIIISGLSSGVYTVQPVAKVLLNGEEMWLEGATTTKTVTSIPSVTDYYVRSSYSNNGTVKKTNDIYGDKLRVKAALSDAYVQNNFVGSTTFYYGSNTSALTLGAEKEHTLSASAWGQYVCYVKISLKNGYSFESARYTTHVTGIPYTYDFDAVKEESNNWLGWTPQGASKATTSGGYKVFKLNSGYMVSPKHHAPASIAITATASCFAYMSKANFVMSATNATNAKSTSGTEQSVSSSVWTTSIASKSTSKSWGITVSGSTPYIYISANKNNTYVVKVSVAYQ